MTMPYRISNKTFDKEKAYWAERPPGIGADLIQLIGQTPPTCGQYVGSRRQSRRGARP